jgi:hypothetical protein
VAPVNRIPPEILALIPDFWDKYYDDRDQDLVALTHVCRAWREVFISRSSLWINLDCQGEDQARTYLERSKSLPVNLSLDTTYRLTSYHPFFEIIPHAVGRLRSLYIEGPLEDLEHLTAHLSPPAPLLEKLSICGYHNDRPHIRPVLTPTLFNEDLSSLRSLYLEHVCTRLPWRNMANLTSLKLFHTSPDGLSIGELLDFFESAPRLRKVILFSATATSGAQNGRLVPLTCLGTMDIMGSGSASLLLDHLLIPAGADLTIEVDLPGPPVQGHPPRFLGNLRNLANFTDIHLHVLDYTQMLFSGPNGEIKMIPSSSRVHETCLILESLDHFDTSKVERLRIYYGYSPSSGPLYQALLPMKCLHTLALHHSVDLDIFIHALHPNMSSSGDVVCPKLGNLVIVFDEMRLDMKSIIGVVAARASRGAKLKLVRIIGPGKIEPTDVLELKKYVLDVVCGHEVEEG